jgi:hypothetical protein
MAIGGLGGGLLAGLSGISEGLKQAQQQRVLQQHLAELKRKQDIQNLLGQVDLSAFGSPSALGAGGAGGVAPVNQQAPSPMMAGPQPQMPGVPSVSAQPPQPAYDPSTDVTARANAEPSAMSPLGPASVYSAPSEGGGKFTTQTPNEATAPMPQPNYRPEVNWNPMRGGSAVREHAGDSGVWTRPADSRQLSEGAPIERESLPQPLAASEIPQPPAVANDRTFGEKAGIPQQTPQQLGGGQGDAGDGPSTGSGQAEAPFTPTQNAQGQLGVSIGGSGFTPLDRLLGHQVDLGQVQAAIRKARPNADPGAAWGATVELYNLLNKGSTADRLASIGALNYLSRSGALEVRKEEGAANRASREGIAAGNIAGRASEGALNRGARAEQGDLNRGVRTSEGALNRDARMQTMLTREGRVDARMALRQADAANRAALVSGDKQKSQQISAIRARIAALAAKNPGLAPSEEDQKQLDALGAELGKLMPSTVPIPNN